MNYYKRHLGDYARDTGHLSALEHGIYTLLLDWYYVNECPIPESKAIRIARGNPDETQMVLTDFFKLTPDGWIHTRANREIAEYQDKAARNREVGKLGGRPSKTQTVSKVEPNRTLAISHKPLTNKDQKLSAKKDSKSKAQTLTSWISDLEGDAITAADPIFDWAGKVGIPRDWIVLAWWSFEGRYTGDGQGHAKKYADWRATFRNAVKDDWLKLWYVGKDGYVLTTAGQQAQREMAA